MKSFRYVVADVFTDTPLAGNGLAVFTDAREIPEEQVWPTTVERDVPRIRDHIKAAYDNRDSAVTYMKILRPETQ